MSSLRNLCCLLTLSCVAGPAVSADRFDDVRTHIRAGLIDQSVPSIAVAVAQDGKILWEEGFGWADREQRRPASEHTVYSLASISKPITATGLMTLVQAGRVDLERPVNDYLGNVKLRARVGSANDATVRRVANHTSGLPLHYQFFYADEPFQRPSMDETLLRYGDLVTAPGERYQYSNLGYGVLDYLIERVSGVSYAEFMRREVFSPLGLTHTSVDIGPGLEPYTATRYGLDGLPLPFYDFDHPGASAVFSSAHDLVRFGMFHLQAHLRDQKAILSDAMLDEMHRRTAEQPNGAGYGVGFGVREQNGYPFISHNGSMPGVATRMALFPRERLAIVVLSNARSDLTLDVADRIIANLLPKWRPATPLTTREESPFVAPDSLRGVWKGMLSTYTQQVPVELRFLPGGDVHAQVGDQLTALVNRPQLEGNIFSGDLAVRIGTPDTDRYAYTVSLSLQLRGDVLNGSASAIAVASPRERNAVSHWIELRKAPEVAGRR
jgi:CubicO group peptidase (beta-lactamase class C family)